MNPVDEDLLEDQMDVASGGLILPTVLLSALVVLIDAVQTLALNIDAVQTMALNAERVAVEIEDLASIQRRRNGDE